MEKYLLTTQNPRWFYKLYIESQFVAAGFGGEDDGVFIPVLTLNNEVFKAMFPEGYKIICKDDFVSGFYIDHSHENVKKNLIDVVPVKLC